jgi:uncharacterized protein
MPKLVHFEISADQPDRAIKFYKKVFAWDIQKDENAADDYWVVMPKDDEPYVTGGITKRVYATDSTVNVFEVTSVDGFGRRIIDAGGKVYEDSPISLPGLGYMHYCEDPDGNVFGIIQYDEKAR